MFGKIATLTCLWSTRKPIGTNFVRVTVANRGPETAELHLCDSLASQYHGHGQASQNLLWHSIKPRAQYWPTKARLAIIDFIFPMAARRCSLKRNQHRTTLRRKKCDTLCKGCVSRYVVNGETAAVNPELKGTKAAVQYKFAVPSGGEVSIKLRLRKIGRGLSPPALWVRNSKIYLPNGKLRPTHFTQTSSLPQLAPIRAT